MSNVTHLLSRIEEGDQQASEDLLPLVYDELRRLAAAKMASERPEHTLQATALVNEAYLRLVGSEHSQMWKNRGHFFSAAAESMRRILIDHARRKDREKRGGDRRRVDLDDVVLFASEGSQDMIALDEALAKLAQARSLIDASGRAIRLEIDGGVKVDNIRAIAAAGGTPPWYHRGNARPVFQYARAATFPAHGKD